MSTEKMRADFEAWLAGSGLSYAEGIGAWYGWQASRAALVVEQSGLVLMPKEPTDSIVAAMKRELDKSPALWCRYSGAYRAAIRAAMAAKDGQP